MPVAQRALRLAAIEAVVVRGISLSAAERETGARRGTISRWVSAFKESGCTLEQLRTGRNFQRSPRELSPITPALQALISKTIEVAHEGKAAPDLLLRATAPYVLHPDAPLDHLAAWVRYFVREWGL